MKTIIFCLILLFSFIVANVFYSMFHSAAISAIIGLFVMAALGMTIDNVYEKVQRK